MENEFYKNEFVDEIGNIAKIIDKELSIFDRMKIRKKTLKKMGLALLFYFFVIIIFNFIL